jgi:hypothetical protein
MRSPTSHSLLATAAIALLTAAGAGTASAQVVYYPAYRPVVAAPVLAAPVIAAPVFAPTYVSNYVPAGNYAAVSARFRTAGGDARHQFLLAGSGGGADRRRSGRRAGHHLLRPCRRRGADAPGHLWRLAARSRGVRDPVLSRSEPATPAGFLTGFPATL